MTKQESDRRYYLKNRQRLIEYQKQYAQLHKENIKEYKSRRLLFKGERIFLDKNPRIGKCSRCDFVGRTNIHHMHYDDTDPLIGVVELCPTCHIDEHHIHGDFR